MKVQEIQKGNLKSKFFIQTNIISKTLKVLVEFRHKKMEINIYFGKNNNADTGLFKYSKKQNLTGLGE